MPQVVAKITGNLELAFFIFDVIVGPVLDKKKIATYLNQLEGVRCRMHFWFSGWYHAGNSCDAGAIFVLGFREQIFFNSNIPGTISQRWISMWFPWSILDG